MSPLESPFDRCFDGVHQLTRHGFLTIQERILINVSKWDAYDLQHNCLKAKMLWESLKVEGKFSEPLVWIGIYIAIASAFCIFAMAADLFHGFRNRKFWFPCKYFSLNTVAMKLTVDLSSPMPGYIDQVAKLGSMVFMCVMAVNLMPSLASMDNKTLLANVTGMVILIITMIVNICIEIGTGVIYGWVIHHVTPDLIVPAPMMKKILIMAYIFYMVLLFLLLIILIYLAITIPTSKQILETKYQAINITASNDQQIGMPAVEKLKQHVKRYWVLAESGSPQFVITINPLSYASSIICVIGLLMYILIVWQAYLFFYLHFSGRSPWLISIMCRSEYRWSMVAIFITQFIGAVVGSIAPIFRCFGVLSFNLVTTWDRNIWVVFKVEKHMTQKLHEWKESRLPFLQNSHRSRTLVRKLKNLVLSLCIGFQHVIVVSCKMIGLVRIVVLIFVACSSYCWKSFKALLFSTPIGIASSNDDIKEDLSNYVLQIEDDMEIAQKTLKSISKSMDHFMKKVEKEHCWQ